MWRLRHSVGSSSRCPCIPQQGRRSHRLVPPLLALPRPDRAARIRSKPTRAAPCPAEGSARYRRRTACTSTGGTGARFRAMCGRTPCTARSPRTAVLSGARTPCDPRPRRARIARGTTPAALHDKRACRPSGNWCRPSRRSRPRRPRARDRATPTRRGRSLRPARGRQASAARTPRTCRGSRPAEPRDAAASTNCRRRGRRQSGCWRGSSAQCAAHRQNDSSTGCHAAVTSNSRGR